MLSIRSNGGTKPGAFMYRKILGSVIGVFYGRDLLESNFVI